MKEGKYGGTSATEVVESMILLFGSAAKAPKSKTSRREIRKTLKEVQAHQPTFCPSVQNVPKRA